MSRLNSKKIICVFALVTQFACAGKTPKLDEQKEFPTGADKALVDQFAIKDVGTIPTAPPTPVSEPSPVPLPSPSSAPTSLVSAEKSHIKSGKKSEKKKAKNSTAAKAAATSVVATPSPAPTQTPVIVTTPPAIPATPLHTPAPSPGSRSIRPTGREPYPLGETLTFEVSYFGVAGGYLSLESLPHKQVNGREVYHIHGKAETSKVFSLFYKMQDTLDSFIDFEGFFTQRFEINLDESMQAKQLLELYDSEKLQTFFWRRWNHKKNGYSEVKETKPIPKFPQDFVSSLYYLRAIDLPIGKEIHYPFAQEGTIQDASVTVLRKETMDTFFGDVSVIVMKLATFRDGQKQQKEDSFLYMTDDDRRVPVKLEAKVRIGTVSAKLVDFKRP